ncbi:MAG: hypothetical protein V4584_12065 [Verrucomicrobiota bacterium]
MFEPSRFSLSKSSVYAASIAIQATCGLNAQNFTARSANLNPFGVNGPLPFGQVSDFGGSKNLKGGFTSGIEISSNYDSNVLLSENDPESDVSLSLTPTVSYTSDPEGGARMVVSGTYAPSANASLSDSEYNSFDQSANVSMIVSGSRTTISAFAGISQDSGVDSLAVSQGFFTGTAISLGIQGTYQLAPRTSVYTSWSSSITDYGDGSAAGFNGHSLIVGGSWAATERLSFGPSFSYSTSSADNNVDINTWGLSLVGSYKVSEKIQVSASLGGQYSDYSQEGSSGDLSPSVSLNANYKINELWSWSGSIQPGILPSPTQTNYSINTWSISSALNRSLIIGSLRMGMDAQIADYESVGTVGIGDPQDGGDNIGVFLSYGRPFFSDRIGFSSSIRYARGLGQSEWSQIQLNAGLNMAF